MWSRAAIVWVNYPNNPTGAVAPLSFYERLAALAAEHDVLLASDEAYSELWFESPPPSALEVLGRGARIAVFNSLSKRSSMTGYRSAFVAGDEDVIAALGAFRPIVRDDAAGVRAARLGRRLGGRGARRGAPAHATGASATSSSDVLARKGLTVTGSAATMFLWVDRSRTARTSEAFAERLLEAGIVVTPGAYLGAAGEGYVRIALVPTEEECARAASCSRSCCERRADPRDRRAVGVGRRRARRRGGRGGGAACSTRARRAWPSPARTAGS